MQSQGPRQPNQSRRDGASAASQDSNPFLGKRTVPTSDHNGIDDSSRDRENRFSGEPADFATAFARIKVVGVGGAGGNAINRMVEAGVDGIEFVAVKLTYEPPWTPEMMSVEAKRHLGIADGGGW